MDDRGRVTFALRLEYDGAGFGGSQFQANARTVQGELERAIEPLTTCRRRVALAGRTDSGVHATGQVAAVQLPASWSAATVMQALNARLPEDLAVTAAVEAPEGFDPRHHAVSRRYVYRVLNDSTRSPLLRRTTWQV
ncbi:MAG: tRNA pseudouridine synthase A, partial [Dehalococcoidia bacterium]